MGRKLALLLLVGLAVACIVSMAPRVRMAGHGSEGRPAPELTIRTPDGSRRLADMKGKVVLVDFWATWCGPCRESIPVIEGLYERYRDRGFVVLGASRDSDDAVVPPFAKDMGITYPVGRPTTEEAVEQYGVTDIPAMALIDRKGIVRWQGTGFGSESGVELAGRIETLLKEQ